MSAKTFYLTTPIYYVNARPHIGHAYTTIVADVLARRHRLLGDDTYFLTGTDEHGQKIERSAAAAGVPPLQFADQVSESFRALWQRMGITHDQFIRTTSPQHAQGVQKLFRTLYEKGFIYLDSYTGSYCVSDEAFVDAPVGTPCPDCGRLLEEVTEENFFFKLSAFQQKLIDLIESNTLVITPDSSRNEVLSFIKGGLKDLSISRSSFTWGIPVPEEIQAKEKTKQKHVIYVWLDALANYMTALGYGSDDESQWQKFWPADLHLVGKEITRFHCVYWPAFLLAAELPLPKQVTAHGWLLFDNSKMSKSKGNIVRTETILDGFGEHVYGAQFPESTKAERDLFAADVLRYFLLREIPFGQDGSFSFEALITRYNADLANGYGNLVSRVLNMIEQYCGGNIPDAGSEQLTPFSNPQNVFRWDDLYIFDSGTYTEAGHEYLGYEEFDFGKRLAVVIGGVAVCDSQLTQTAPWKRAKSPELKHTVPGILREMAEGIRIITALLYPILPTATAKVWAQLGLGDIEAAARHGELTNLQWGGLKPGTKLGALGPVFPRAPKELAQIMTDMENPTPNEESSQPETQSAAAEVASHLVSPSHPASPSLESPTIGIDDFAKIDLRVAQIVLAERIPKADKLLRLEVDLGPMGKRQILSGIAEWYTPEELTGRRIVVIANLAPRKMRGLESHGMLLAASEEGGKPYLATCGDEIALGARLK